MTVRILQIVAMLLPLLPAAAERDETQARPAWNDISVIPEHAGAPRAQFLAYRSEAAALANEPGARGNAKRVNIHVNDIVPRDIVSLDIDYGQMGGGGDDSWGKRTLQKYSLNKKEYEYRFTLQPYTVASERLDRLLAR